MARTDALWCSEPTRVVRAFERGWTQLQVCVAHETSTPHYRLNRTHMHYGESYVALSREAAAVLRDLDAALAELLVSQLPIEHGALAREPVDAIESMIRAHAPAIQKQGPSS